MCPGLSEGCVTMFSELLFVVSVIFDIVFVHHWTSSFSLLDVDCAIWLVNDYQIQIFIQCYNVYNNCDYDGTCSVLCQKILVLLQLFFFIIMLYYHTQMFIMDKCNGHIIGLTINRNISYWIRKQADLSTQTTTQSWTSLGNLLQSVFYLEFFTSHHHWMTPVTHP